MHSLIVGLGLLGLAVGLGAVLGGTEGAMKTFFGIVEIVIETITDALL